MNRYYVAALLVLAAFREAPAKPLDLKLGNGDVLRVEAVEAGIFRVRLTRGWPLRAVVNGALWNCPQRLAGPGGDGPPGGRRHADQHGGGHAGCRACRMGGCNSSMPGANRFARKFCRRRPAGRRRNCRPSRPARHRWPSISAARNARPGRLRSWAARPRRRPQYAESMHGFDLPGNSFGDIALRPEASASTAWERPPPAHPTARPCLPLMDAVPGKFRLRWPGAVGADRRPGAACSSAPAAGACS